MSDRVDELVAMLTARICLSPDCSGDISCEDCQDIAREAIAELATIAQDAEHLRKQRDAARAILADALNAMRDLGALEDGTPADFRAWKAYQDGAMLLGWCIDPAYANDGANAPG